MGQDIIISHYYYYIMDRIVIMSYCNLGDAKSVNYYYYCNFCCCKVS